MNSLIESFDKLALAENPDASPDASSNASSNANANCDALREALREALHAKKPDHRGKIMAVADLKHAHAYCKANRLSGQQFGPLIEYYITSAIPHMKKIGAKKHRGDLYCTRTGKYFELKVSLGGTTCAKFNFVQIRLAQKCDYILTAYLLRDENLNQHGELFIFQLTRGEMAAVVDTYGHQAHRDTELHALRPTYGGKCWRELLKHRVVSENLGD